MTMSTAIDAAALDRNLFEALREAFPADLDAVAIETDTGLCYS